MLVYMESVLSSLIVKLKVIFNMCKNWIIQKTCLLPISIKALIPFINMFLLSIICTIFI